LWLVAARKLPEASKQAPVWELETGSKDLRHTKTKHEKNGRDEETKIFRLRNSGACRSCWQLRNAGLHEQLVGGWMVKASIVIASYNANRFLGECLSSVYDSKKVFGDLEVVLVDNASTDGTREFVKQNFSQVRYIRSEKNLGFAKGNNTGIVAAKGDYIVLLNSDTVVTSTWLSELVRVAENDRKAGIVGPKTLRFDRRTLDTTGHIFHHKIGEAANRGTGEIDHGQYDDDTDVMGVQFSCALIKREVLDSIGLLDNRMFLYLEDVDYCIRARLVGWKVVYCPSSVIYHYAGGSTKQSWRTRRYGYANRLRVVLKNYSTSNMLKWGSFGFVLCLVSVLASFKNRTMDWLGSIYAFYWNIFNFPVRERIFIQRKRVQSDEAIFRYSVRGNRW